MVSAKSPTKKEVNDNIISPLPSTKRFHPRFEDITKMEKGDLNRLLDDLKFPDEETKPKNLDGAVDFFVEKLETLSRERGLLTRRLFLTSDEAKHNSEIHQARKVEYERYLSQGTIESQEEYVALLKKNETTFLDKFRNDDEGIHFYNYCIQDYEKIKSKGECKDIKTYFQSDHFNKKILTNAQEVIKEQSEISEKDKKTEQNLLGKVDFSKGRDEVLKQILEAGGNSNFLFDQWKRNEWGKELTQITDLMEKLIAIPKVRENYEKNYFERHDIVRNGRRLRNLRARDKRASAYLNLYNVETGGDFTPVDDLIVKIIRDEKKSIQKEMKQLEGNKEISQEAFRQMLISFKKQMGPDYRGFVITPTVEARWDQLEDKMAIGKPILIWGHTGGGKSEVTRQFCKRRLGIYPEKLNGGEEVTQFDLWGTITPEGHMPGPITRALKVNNGKGGPFLFEEINNCDYGLLGETHDVIDTKVGDPVNIPLSDEQVIKGPDFTMFATANPKSDKYKREEFDPATIRRYEKLEWGFLPKHEMKWLFYAVIIDNHGSMPEVKGIDNMSETVDTLVDTIDFCQKVYTGEKGVDAEAGASTGKKAQLKKATISPGDLIGIAEGWRKTGFQKSLDRIILENIVHDQVEPNDKVLLAKIFTLNGFFENYNAAQFEIPGLEEDTVNTWKTAATAVAP